MKKMEEILLMIGIVVFAVLLYFAMPYLIKVVVAHSKGTEGIIFFSIVSLVLTIVFFLFGYRGKELVYVIALIFFIALMCWLYFNYHDLDIFISSRYGQLIATAVFLMIILIIFVLGKILL